MIFRCHYKSNQDCDSTETGLVDAKDFLLKRKKIEAEGWGTYSDLYVCFATSDGESRVIIKMLAVV